MARKGRRPVFLPSWRNWQTRMVQVHVPARVWGFESLRWHHSILNGLPSISGPTMPASLDQIVAATRRKVYETRRSADLRKLERQAEQRVPRGFRQALEGRSPAVIAELKKASPSRGLIRADFDPANLAAELESAGAAALSVLTDAEFFQGSLENLRQASVATRLPCLRKDFIVDEFQLLEARANRADAVLLIVAALSPSELETLAKKAESY